MCFIPLNKRYIIAQILQMVISRIFESSRLLAELGFKPKPESVAQT